MGHVDEPLVDLGLFDKDVEANGCELPLAIRRSR